MLYSKFGSVPKTDTDGTDGWVEVDDPPNSVPDGYECVWWSPPGWVIRPVKPAATNVTDFAWSQSSEQWVEFRTDGLPIQVLTTQSVNVL
jgi:hypothetical protein